MFLSVILEALPRQMSFPLLKTKSTTNNTLNEENASSLMKILLSKLIESIAFEKKETVSLTGKR
jgi:hypothetical protein